jgi:glycosyltransferase involved in cell wall biosynthesis
LPAILAQVPEARVVHAGSWKGVIGEEAYQERINAMVADLGDKWMSTGYLSDEDFLAFFAACDVLVFSSLNSTESFGIVQIEALSQGTLIVASDLPGVRQPVLQTGMGRIVPIRDGKALAAAIVEVLRDKKSGKFEIPKEYIAEFSQEKVALRYLEAFERLLHD